LIIGAAGTKPLRPLAVQQNCVAGPVGEIEFSNHIVFTERERRPEPRSWRATEPLDGIGEFIDLDIKPAQAAGQSELVSDGVRQFGKQGHFIDFGRDIAVQ
jgi:hypothetical protein